MRRATRSLPHPEILGGGSSYPWDSKWRGVT